MNDPDVATQLHSEIARTRQMLLQHHDDEMERLRALRETLKANLARLRTLYAPVHFQKGDGRSGRNL
jgi:hypothetical protein